MRLIRRLRGALGTGLTWAGGWGVLGAIHGAVIGAIKPWQWDLYNPVTTTAFGYAIAGLVAGTGFGALLAVLDRRTTIAHLSRVRVAIWGAAGGALVPVVVHLTRGLTSSAGWGDVALTASVTGLLGAASALATLKLARRTPDALETQREREMLSEPAPDWGGVAGAGRGEKVPAGAHREGSRP